MRLNNYTARLAVTTATSSRPATRVGASSIAPERRTPPAPHRPAVARYKQGVNFWTPIRGHLSKPFEHACGARCGATIRMRILILIVAPQEFASVLWCEGLSRHFDNRRQVAAYAGLAPTPWQSGSINREQGISQSGNPRLRTTMISSLGFGYAISRARRSLSGSRTEWNVAAVVGARRRSWRWRESCWSRSGNM